jgi:solute:Na+ symporter, SSS family
LSSAATLSGSFGPADWAVVLGVLVLTTWIGARKAGEQKTLRDFFLGGRRLPWYAVSASIVATEISAVTFIGLPASIYMGDAQYLQIVILGSLVARVLVGVVLVPRYYEHEVYSPYEYMAARLGGRVRETTTLLFALGGVLGQSARVFMTALVLRVILFRELGWLEDSIGVPPLAAAVCAIGIVAVAWTWIGGIATVVWTDAVLFLLFLAGAAIALVTVGAHVDGGLAAALGDAHAAGKLRVLDFSSDLTDSFTVLAALIGMGIGGVGAYGTDQLMAQRLFCCRTAGEARRAMIASYVAVIPILLVALVGAALWSYHVQHPLAGAAAALVAARSDAVFPVFVVEVVPAGLKGVVLAGAFAAAISSLDSILAALAQTTLGAALRGGRGARERAQDPDQDRRTLRVSRALVLCWAVVLCAAAVWIERLADDHGSVLELALAMAGYTGGGLLAGFFLAFLPLRIDGRGYPWGAALSVFTIFALNAHRPAIEELVGDPGLVCLGFGALTATLWIFLRVVPDLGAGVKTVRVVCQSLLLIAGLAAIAWLGEHGYFVRSDPAGRPLRAVLAWPYYIPLGALVAFLWGWGLSGSRAAGAFGAPAGGVSQQSVAASARR